MTTCATAQLGLSAATDLALYQSPDTWWDHQAFIRQHYGYQDMLTRSVLIPLLRWLYTRAWTHAERPSVLFDLTTAWLVERKIVLPGVTVVARLVARVRDRVIARLWRSLAHLPTPTQHTQLAALLTVPADRRTTLLDQIRHPPTRVSAPRLV